MSFLQKDAYTINDLLQLMELLRSPRGCPWDREQTHDTIRKNFIEETYEAVEAIDRCDAGLLKEELGDVLLQVVFHTEMEREKNVFDFDGVCDGICKKLISRHPHVFSNAVANSSDDVLRRWDDLKQQEKRQVTHTQTLQSVARTLPALMRSEKVQQRAARAGFDYDDVSGALADLHSELQELTAAIAAENAEQIADELGDVLFSAANVARLTKIDSEQALAASCDKFIRRFGQVEQLAYSRHINLNQSEMTELNTLWQEAKIKDEENLEVISHDKGRTY